MRPSITHFAGTEQETGVLVETIGFHHRQKHYRDAGIPAYRLMMFHNPVTVSLPEKEFNCGANTLFVFPPQEPVNYQAIDGDKYDHSWIRLSGRQLPSILSAYGIPVNQPIHFDTASVSDKWLTLLREECGHTPKDEEMINGILRIWLLKIKKRVTESTPELPAAVQKVKQHIDNNYLLPLSLEELAGPVKLSRSHLCVLFRKNLGTTPIEYQLRLRILHAARLLENRNLSITEIAELCGFSDVYYFSRLFKKRMKFPPSEYRRHTCNPLR